MEIVKLPPRLAAIANMVPEGTRLADVGTDHGLIPIRLLQEGRIRSAIASDIRPGPLSRAKANAAQHGVEGICFVLCDGLRKIAPNSADTIVIAGMGGETIAAILASAPWTREGKTLLLQPMSRPEALRAAFERLEMRIEEEKLVRDAGKLYSILRVRGGMPLRLSEAELYTGAYALISGQELFPEHLRQWKSKTSAALQGLARSSKPEDAARRERLRRVWEQLGKMSEQEVALCQE